MALRSNRGKERNYYQPCKLVLVMEYFDNVVTDFGYTWGFKESKIVNETGHIIGYKVETWVQDESGVFQFANEQVRIY